MNLTCPGCGFVAAIEIFASDVDARHFAELMGKVPPEISDLVLRYVALFAPAKHKMTFSRGRRVLAELVPLIAARKVTRNRREWPAPLASWDTALAHMIERRAQLTLPLRSHGYLLEVVVGLADKVEAQAEARVEQLRREGTAPAAQAGSTRVEESTEQRMARMRREQEARDLAQGHVAGPAPAKADDPARASARKAAEEDIKQRRARQATGEPQHISDFIPPTP